MKKFMENNIVQVNMILKYCSILKWSHNKFKKKVDNWLLWAQVKNYLLGFQGKSPKISLILRIKIIIVMQNICI